MLKDCDTLSDEIDDEEYWEPYLVVLRKWYRLCEGFVDEATDTWSGMVDNIAIWQAVEESSPHSLSYILHKSWKFKYDAVRLLWNQEIDSYPELMFFNYMIPEEATLLENFNPEGRDYEGEILPFSSLGYPTLSTVKEVFDPRWLPSGEPYVFDLFSAESYKPPASAVSNAKKGLAQRKEWGRGGLSPSEAKAQGIDSGVTRARKIASGSVSRHDVRRMSAFNRHRKNNRPDKKMPDGGPTAGTIAWNLWGGTSGVNWAKKKSAAMNAESYDADGRDMTLEEIEETYGEGRLCDHCFDGTFERGTHDDGSTYYRCWKCKQFEAESVEAETWGVQIYDTDLTMADVKKMLKDAGIKTKGSVRKIGNGYGYYFKFDSSHQSKFENAFNKFGKAGNYEYEAEDFGAETFEDCEVCHATVDKGTLNDVQAGRICNECHKMNQYEGGTKTIKTPYNAETFESPVSCKICGKTFDSFRGLNGHMNAHLPPHRKRAESEERYRKDYMVPADIHRILESAVHLQQLQESHDGSYPEWWKSKLSVVASQLDNLTDVLDYKVDHPEEFDAEDLMFNDWSKQEMMSHGDQDSFEDWLEHEIDKHGNVSLREWGDDEEKSHMERYGAEDYNSFTNDMEALLAKYSQLLLTYETEYQSKERGGDGIMEVFMRFKPYNAYFDDVDFDAEDAGTMGPAGGYWGGFSGSHDGVVYKVSFNCSHDLNSRDSYYISEMRNYVEAQISNGYDSGSEPFVLTDERSGKQMKGTVTWESIETFDAEDGSDSGCYDPDHFDCNSCFEICLDCHPSKIGGQDSIGENLCMDCVAHEMADKEPCKCDDNRRCIECVNCLGCEVQLYESGDYGMMCTGCAPLILNAEELTGDEDIKLGDVVRSYDFCLGGKVTNDDCYVEGIVEKIEPVEWCGPNCDHYHIKTIRRIFNGKPTTYEDYYFPVADPNQSAVRRVARWSAEDWGGDPEGILAKALSRARMRSKEPRKPLKIEKLPHRDQKTLKDFEAVVIPKTSGYAERAAATQMAIEASEQQQKLLELQTLLNLKIISPEDVFAMMLGE